MPSERVTSLRQVPYRYSHREIRDIDDVMTHRAEVPAVLAGGGEMGALMRTVNWASTGVGPVESWPQSLRTALSILMETGFPMYIAWGPDFTQFYNDAYRPILGSTKHPAAMGISTRITFAEIWDVIGPMFLGVMGGQTTTLNDFMVHLDRHGFAEECYFLFSYSPIREESGGVGGVLVTCTETTARVLGERRLLAIQALTDNTHGALSVREAVDMVSTSLQCHPVDIPAVRIYQIDPHAECATLASSTGTEIGIDLPDTIPLDNDRFVRLMADPAGTVFQVVDWQLEPCATGANVPAGGRTLAVAIATPGISRPTGILVVTTSNALVFDSAYSGFLVQIASQVGIAIASAQALADAKARAEALAELDRAKTDFFSNVSHEFRTPLTLMLGPTEDALASPERSLQGEDLEAVYRNELRLLKLVNTLLDFSRIEAGRATARFEQTDIGVLTANLASAFRSATERVGIDLVVRCAPISAPVFVDREMWEKVVLNLLSNAFKFTFQGSIEVDVAADATHIELRVRDTGTGIAADDVAKVFDRFYRIENPKARTHEGSGIGLALVHELVRLHGGSISATSVEGSGTAFTVRLPLGASHLPADQVVLSYAMEGNASTLDDSMPAHSAAHAYVEEALRWLPTSFAVTDDAENIAAETYGNVGRVLVVDDNADMRDYLARLLKPRFDVVVAADGNEALRAARQLIPDVLISDIMMPGLDGFELLEQLRASPETRRIPVIMLSARAGEEARLEGLHAGADEYLVKPFSARELLARVDAQLVRSKLRTLEEQSAVRLATVFAHAPVGVAILQGPHHVFEFANEEYRALVSGHELDGKSVRAAMPELEGQGIYELLDTVYRTGEKFVGRSVPVRLQQVDGTMNEIFVDFVYHPVRNASNKVTGIAVVAFDVTELTKARRDAEAANVAKDEFLAMLGHELRNPLAPIVTALQVMRLRQVSGAERERTIIERQVKHVVNLVDDLLDVSRITRGQVKLRREMLDIADVLAKAIESTGPAMEERQQVLKVEVPRGLMVVGDPSRLVQVMSNVLTNAAKYTNAGGRITIDGELLEGFVVLTVTDTGRGISADMLPRIFDMFAQERQEIDRSEGGLGLGLAIVKNLVQVHGGTVQAQSAGKGEGATFIIRLPAATTGPPHTTTTGDFAAIAERPAVTGLRILVVDDNTDAVELLAEALRTLGHETRQAEDGPSAVREAAAFIPHVVLLDIGLPIMDGFQVARRIRALPGMGNVELAAVTGYGRDNDRALTRAAGFNKHMVKPVDLLALNHWLQELSSAD